MSEYLRVHTNDLPSLENYKDPINNEIAVDTKSSGRNFYSYKLNIIQLSPGDGSCDIIQLDDNWNGSPNILKLFADHKITKIFHSGCFDLSVLFKTFGDISIAPIFDIKIASKLIRPYQKHSLKHLMSDIFDINKIYKYGEKTKFDWNYEKLDIDNDYEKLNYLSANVVFYHRLKILLEKELIREGYEQLAKSCFEFLPTKSKLNLIGFDKNIF